MAQKKIAPGFFEKTTQEHKADHSDLNEGAIRAVGVGLRKGEIAALDAICNEYGISRNALLKYATQLFIIDYREGKINLAGSVEVPPEPKKRLIMPST